MPLGLLVSNVKSPSNPKKAETQLNWKPKTTFQELVKIMKKVPSKLNLIEFNPLANKSFKPASQDNIDKFSKIIQDNGFLSLFRRSRGRDINASCGSLVNKKATGNG